jgi:hypothetical protein
VNDSTDLAHGQINGTETIAVQLLRPEDTPAVNRTLHLAVVRILWPLQPTIVASDHFPDTAAMLTRLFAEAATKLAQIKARKWTL